MVTKIDIINFIKGCGIKPTDKVTIHTSLRAIGEIENGADGLIDVFKEYLTDGLFIVPTHTWGVVNRENPFYDVKATKAHIGVMSQVASSRVDGVRSLHPTHSVTVFGKNASEFIKGEELCSTPAPVGCCLSRLHEENGKILLIGVGLERNTYIHAVEERLNIPNRLTEEGFDITVKDYDGNLIKIPSFRSHRIMEGVYPSISSYYPKYKHALEYVGGVKYSKLGNALAYCCDARKLTDVIATIYKRSNKDLCFSLAPIPKKYYE